MVNTDDFIKRLETILEYNGLTASSFADKIGAQRSSMSHLLSGRNKPSLDFILKIIEVFPDVDLYWILNGTGSFPKNSESTKNVKLDSSFQNITSPTHIDLFSPIPSLTEKELSLEKMKDVKVVPKNEDNDEIEKIVLFYKNGTFKTYNPNREN